MVGYDGACGAARGVGVKRSFGRNSGRWRRSGRGGPWLWLACSLVGATLGVDGLAADNGSKVVPGKLNEFNPADDTCDDHRTGVCTNNPSVQCVDNSQCADNLCSAQVEPCAVIDGRKQRPGDVSLELNFRSPPVPSQVAQATEQLRRANKILCDATDGTVRIARVIYSLGESSRERADIWWFPQDGRAYATGRDFTSDATHIQLFNYFWDGLDSSGRQTSMSGSTIAHELGHSLLGFADDYSESRIPRGVAFDGPSTMESWVDGRVVSRGIFNNELAIRQLVDQTSETFHTIMQSAGGSSQACAQPGNGLTTFQARPRSWSNFQCLTPQDCQPGGYPANLPPLWRQDPASTEPEYTDCPDLPILASELSSRNSNVDSVKGDGLDCPTEPLPGLELVIQGVINSLNSSCGRDADGDGLLLDTNEQCEDTQTTPCASGGTATCERCLWKRSSCSNGTECQPGQTTSCNTLGLLPQGNGVDVSCAPNGYWESHVYCQLPIEPTLANGFQVRPNKQFDYHVLASHAPLWATEIPVRDASLDEATAYHRLWVRVVEQSTEAITLELAADGGDFAPGGAPGTPGTYHRLAVWDISWVNLMLQPESLLPAGSVGEINGSPYSPEMTLDLVLGSSSQVATFMTNSSAAGRFNVVPTGPFANGEPEQVELPRFGGQV